jgi:hypothetical protein
VPALLIAAYLVKSLPLTAVRWVVLVVVSFTAIMLLQAGRREARALRLGALAPVALSP